MRTFKIRPLPWVDRGADLREASTIFKTYRVAKISGLWYWGWNTPAQDNTDASLWYCKDRAEGIHYCEQDLLGMILPLLYELFHQCPNCETPWEHVFEGEKTDEHRFFCQACDVVYSSVNGTALTVFEEGPDPVDIKNMIDVKTITNELAKKTT